MCVVCSSSPATISPVQQYTKHLNCTYKSDLGVLDPDIFVVEEHLGVLIPERVCSFALWWNIQVKLTPYLQISEIACLETDGADVWQRRTDVHKLAVRGFTNWWSIKQGVLNIDNRVLDACTYADPWVLKSLLGSDSLGWVDSQHLVDQIFSLRSHRVPLWGRKLKRIHTHAFPHIY